MGKKITEEDFEKQREISWNTLWLKYKIKEYEMNQVKEISLRKK